MIYYGVTLQKQQDLQARMAASGIREEDIIEKFVRSGGKGGQNVNKTATCVYLRHVPTGIEVKCQRERVQSINRFLARRLLVERVEAMAAGRLSAAERERERIRRQKRRRSRRAKNKMLDDKRVQGEKKDLRRKVDTAE